MKGNYQEAAGKLIEAGEHMIALGQAIRNPKTTITKLVELADKCGYEIDFALIPSESQEEDDESWRVA